MHGMNVVFLQPLALQQHAGLGLVVVNCSNTCLAFQPLLLLSLFVSGIQPGGNKPHGGATDVIRLRADLKSRLFVI